MSFTADAASAAASAAEGRPLLRKRVAGVAAAPREKSPSTAGSRRSRRRPPGKYFLWGRSHRTCCSAPENSSLRSTGGRRCSPREEIRLAVVLLKLLLLHQRWSQTIVPAGSNSGIVDVILSNSSRDSNGSRGRGRNSRGFGVVEQWFGSPPRNHCRRGCC